MELTQNTKSLILFTIMLAAIILALAGCTAPTREYTLQQAQQIELNNKDIEITLLGTFQDDLAYGNIRGIYEIRHNETNQVWIGISGIGISELGTHTKHINKNKITTQDER